MFVLSDTDPFPAAELADEDGLLAIGANLSVERLLDAYEQGIFPWYNEGEPIQWYCPDPRFVLFPQHLNISKSMKTVLGNGSFQFTINRAFPAVIENCKTIFRKDQPGTWIHPEMIAAYTALHERGYVLSAESWQQGKLVGGLYGVLLGHVFFGESMFSKVSNASKFAFIKFVQYLEKKNVQLIDCQIYTPHLGSLGAGLMDREDFLDVLKVGI
ncbi:MAG: leucyl/phenylalanyl-tRNA--protein transferase [Chitinophagaceae bacterium]